MLEGVLEIPEWHKDAACRNVPNPDIFFPERGASIAAARRLCATCPVQAECLEDALEHNLEGLWGNTTERERRPLRKARKLKVA